MLTQAQVRVLGCLLEKERTTPDDYPLTANALMRASNQTTSRWPVVAYDLPTIERSVAELKPLGLIRFVFSPSNRATKYRHVLDEAWCCDSTELALLCLLMLRGPQTAGELKARSERLADLGSVAEVEVVLGRLAARDQPMVGLIDRAPGQKEPRWTQLVGDAPPPEDRVASGAARGGTTERIEHLEARVEVLSRQLAELRDALGIAEHDQAGPSPDNEEQ